MTQALNDAENNLSKQLLLLYIYFYRHFCFKSLSKIFSLLWSIDIYLLTFSCAYYMNPTRDNRGREFIECESMGNWKKGVYFITKSQIHKFTYA